MSDAIDLQNDSVPSESWDDDFDFQSQSGSPKRPRNAPVTMRMSTATEDWDIDSTSVMNHEPPRPQPPQPTVLADRINISAAKLANWTEADPTTPQKASFSVEETTAENWDDDFLDKTDSPVRRSPRVNSNNNTPSRNTIGGKLRAGVPLNHRKAPRGDDHDEEHESWDDEFEFNNSPAKPSKPSTPGKSRRTPIRNAAYRSSISSPGHHHHDLSDDDDDFGRASLEEDRTVTARARRAPQMHTPPPPVPSIPFVLAPTSSTPGPLTATASTSTNTHLSASAPSPRSPTASVFSVPGSSVAETTSLRSTAPLRPSLSRNAAKNANAFKYLPPSPPQHHRERRRLRKKGRPHPQGVMELVDMPGHRYPLSDTDIDQRLDELDERRTPSPPPRTPEPKIVTSSSVPPTPSHSTSNTGGGVLLSRIESVKRGWNARRKKNSSTAPADIPAAKNEAKGKDPTSSSPDGAPNLPGPRPRTSLSSLLRATQQQQQQSSAPPPSSSWFFRPTSPSNTRGGGRISLGKMTSITQPRASYTGSRSGSMTDLSMRGSIYASSSNCEDDDNDASGGANQKTPNKLVKRKSLGFVQLRRGLMPMVGPGTGASFIDKGKEKESSTGDLSSSLDVQKGSSAGPSKRPMSMQPQRLPSGLSMRASASLRHASYGTSRSRKGPDNASTEDFHEPINATTATTRDRKTSSRSVRPTFKVVPKSSKESVVVQPKEKEKDEGSRSFMGSMRRLSLVGRHRRNKSGASLMETMSRLSSEGASPPTTTTTAPMTPPPPPTMPQSSTDPPTLPPLPPMSRFQVPRPRTPHPPPAPPVLSFSRSEPVPSLLPPIELQPPSPPRPPLPTDMITATLQSPGIDSLLSPISTAESSSVVSPISASTHASMPPSPSSSSSFSSSSPRSKLSSSRPSPPKSQSKLRSPPPRTPKTTSPLHNTASLGRSTISPKHGGPGGLTNNTGGVNKAMIGAEGFPTRRNSLSDLTALADKGEGGVASGGKELKIPTRISQAQHGLKRDLGMVRDFAVYIEQLKKQQETYHSLVHQMQLKLDAQAHLASAQPVSRAVSPSFFSNLSKPNKSSRVRSNTNPHTSGTTGAAGVRYKELAAAFYTINSKYRISWECAELLVDLADGTSAAMNPGGTGGGGPSTSVSAPIGLSTSVGSSGGSGGGEKRTGRERAVTLAGDRSRPSTPTTGPIPNSAVLSSMVPSSSMPHPQLPSSRGDGSGPPPASPPASTWRASTGRHDLSHRQLVLLREMLNNAEAVLSADGPTSSADGGGLRSAVPEESSVGGAWSGIGSTDDLRVNRDWKWGGPMSSTITLPSDVDHQYQGGGGEESKKKQRRKSKLVGMAGIRDMLRALKRNVSEVSSGSGSANVNPSKVQLEPPLPVTHNHAMVSTASLSMDTSFDQSSGGHGNNTNHVPRPTSNANASPQQGRKPRSSTGPENVAKPGKGRGRDKNPKDPSPSPSPSPSPYTIQFSAKTSPRRPSLASIFRLGRKHTPTSASTTDLSLHGSENYHTDISSRPGTGFGHNHRMNAGSPQLEEDWDRIDSASDLDAAARALGVSPTSGNSKEGGGTLKLRKGISPYLQQYQIPSSSSSQLPHHPSTPRRSASGSQLSLWAESPSKAKARMQQIQQVTPRAPRLSNVDENAASNKLREQAARERERRRSSSGKMQKSGSVRSMPPQPVFPESRLAMTPENIKPLLENAKEVHARLGDCIMEIRRLLDGDGGSGERSVSGSSYVSGQSAVAP